MAQKLDGKVALITGASSGLGEAIALTLAAEGAKVALAARRADRLEKLVKRISEGNGQSISAKAQSVKRFIPSDYSVDYRKLDYGDNDNLDKRKQVFSYLQQSGLEYTLILNGAFMNNVGTPYMPQFNFDNNTFEYWGDGETPLDFTTTDDTAKYVAEAVSDPNFVNTALEVAGEVLTIKQLLAAYKEATGKKLQEKQLGSIEDLKAWIEQKKTSANSPVEYIPQQYEYTMVSCKGKLDHIQNSRYPNIKPLTVRQFLKQTDL